MSAEYSAKEISLREQISGSEGVLQEYERELQAVDSERLDLTKRQRQYEALARTCDALDELDDLGAAQLFWGEGGGTDKSAGFLTHARRKIEDFGAEIAEVESRRQAIVDKIGDQNEVLDCLHYDLHGAIDEEERRRNNWVIEREPQDWPYRPQVMPWTRGFEEDKRFRRSLSGSVLASFAVAVLVGSIALPIVERSETIKLPERVAKVVREERALPPPVEPVAEPVVPEVDEPEPEPVPSPEVVEELTPESSGEPVLAKVEQPVAVEQAKPKGILAFRDSFASRASIRPVAQLGSQAKLSSAGENAVARPERSMVTTSAPGSSGGINLADISRDTGGGGQDIEGVQVTRVASTIAGGDGPDRPLSGGVSAGRTDEEIQIVFDRYKSTLYRLYNRELRKDPTLRGQLVLRLTIEPDGSVSLCQLQSSDMDAPALAQKILDRVLTFDFGAKTDIVAMTIIYPIDFLPSA